MAIKNTVSSRPVIGVLPGWQVFWVSLQPFLEPMLRGIHVAARDFNCELLIACGLFRQNEMRHRASWTLMPAENDYLPVGVENTNGLIIITNPPNPSIPQLHDYFNELTATGHPIVSIGFSQAKIQILPDNFRGVYQGLQHLYAHGHRNIAYIAGFENSPQNSDGYERQAAYQQFLQDYGLEYNPRLVAYGEHAIASGQQAMEQLLATGIRFTAVLASDDGSAMGAAAVLQQNHIRVPQDIAIIGFDNDLFAGTVTPPLTTTQLPSFDMGYQAVQQLLQEVSAPSSTPKITRVIGPLVIRESCGCTHHQLTQFKTSDSPMGDSPENLVIERIYTAVVTETHHIRSEQLQNFCRELVKAYYTSCQAQNPLPFQTALENILEIIAQVRDDINVWQIAITLLEHHAAQVAQTTPFSTQLLMQARLLVAQRAGYQYSRSVIQHNDMTDYLSRLNAYLHTALTLEDILQVIVAHLAVLHIQTIQIALFESAGRKPDCLVSYLHAHTRGVSRIPGFSRGTVIPTAKNVAPETPYQLALVPLIIENRQMGFLIFEADNLELCGSITWQISAALRGSQLYQQAAQDRQIAEEANRLKSRFLAMVSHELRTPLSLITGLSDILLQKKHADYHTEKYLHQIHASAHHLNGLIGDVLDLASTEMGQLRLAWYTVDLCQLFEAIARAGEQLTQDKGLEWEYDIPAYLPPIWGDATRVRQVALNLVANAVKFTDKGKVQFRVQLEQNIIKVLVSDTGIGIPPEEQDLIFDEFQKSERTSARAYGGMGLGLAICRRLIELHHGEIGVFSSGKEGAGSTFYFTLPIIEAVAENTVHPENDTVLLFVDETINGDALETQLRERNFEVLQQIMGEDIGSILSNVQPAAVIVNNHANHQNGWEILSHIQKNTHLANTTVMLHTQENDQHNLLELDYVTKPLQKDALEKVLHRQGWDTPTEMHKTILIVDDDPGIREMHAQMIYEWSPEYQLVTANNGREALEKLQHIRPDLILLDLMMPEMDGFKLLEHIREMHSTRHIPVIIITAHTLNAEEMARLNRGVATIMSKGMFTEEETIAQIEQALARNRKIGTETQRLVRRAMAFIHTHYAESVAREDIARYVSVSEDYLTRCFKQETGISPIAYLNRYRVNQAKQLLEDSNMNMTEIALAVGFTDNMHFSRAFRRESGMTPTEYRAKH